MKLILIIWLSLWAVPVFACPVPVKDELAIHLDAINQAREAAGRGKLALSPELTRIAQDHACDMARRGYFSHASPEGADMMDRLAAAQLQGICRAAENIARGQRDIPQVMRTWLRSDGHRRNMLDRRLTLVGIGRAAGPHWVQLFAAEC
ncbi:CAP domain-containing protein [Roseinatronobacter alkalisoli]|uniref:CAP domain-containing protein n=1 Tax=Roseinatronobacter alkalisoli TaxID=3028235 RepID=A0ABT5T4Q4_9RHOB|nr:CAP domain-containing protein [Roseinatronobacter sp. HJB301]MDD7970092.1 CAP domain-containing protein [Roseinatronobacter sp. HJB301]